MSAPRQSHTQRVLEALEKGHREPEENPDSDNEHVDERWLVSYSDMMTLLFGLFVMLYSMAGEMDVVRKSIQEKFGGSAAVTAASGATMSDPRADSSSPEEPQEEKLKVLRLAEKVQELERSLEATKAEAAAKRLPENAVTAAASKEDSRIIGMLKTEKANALRSAEKARELERSLEEAKAHEQELSQRLTVLQAELDQQKKLLQSDFLTIIIQWKTAQHDIDLVVTDPNGHRFDFKHRKYDGVPGELTLDTQKGPGIEVWQADELIPGTYKVSYIFYNHYGNKAPAPIEGKVLTSKGAIALPSAVLVHGKAKAANFSFTLDRSGHVSDIRAL